MISFCVIRPSDGKTKSIIYKNKKKIIVGRASTADICYPNMKNLSRVHAKFVVGDGFIEVLDNKSKNGTYVNEVSVTRKRLDIGDRIRVGNLELELIETETKDGKLDEDEILTQTRVFNPADLLLTSKMDISKKLDKEKAFALLYKVSSELIREKLSRKFLTKASGLLKDILMADNVFFCLCDEAGDLIPVPVVEFAETTDPDSVEKLIPSKTLLRKIVNEKIAVMAQDTSSHPQFKDAQSIVFSGIRSLIAAPLLVEDRLLGVVIADTCLARSFNQVHLELLTAAANLLAMGMEQNRLHQRIEKENRIRQRLAQFHSPAIVEEIIKREERIGTSEKYATVWFCDIHGFTAFAENHKPADVEVRINNFFEMGVKSVFHFSGTLDKYLGDGFLAVFGAPFEKQDDSIRAVQAAIDLHGKISRMNRSVPEKEKILIRSGINTGKIIAGDFGSSVRRDYSVLGDVVNVARRVQQETAGIGDIVLGETTANEVIDKIPLLCLGYVSLRGRKEKIKAFSVCSQT